MTFYEQFLFIIITIWLSAAVGAYGWMHDSWDPDTLLGRIGIMIIGLCWPLWLPGHWMYMRLSR